MGNDDVKALSDKLDETIDESFPASDASANTIETGVHIGVAEQQVSVRDNREAHRYEIALDAEVAFPSLRAKT